MSTDLATGDGFAPAVFPRLRAAGSEQERAVARRRGYADGHAEGYRAGLAEAHAVAARIAAQRAEDEARAEHALASVLSALDAATADLTARAAELTGAAERVLTARAIELAETILDEALADRRLSAASALHRAVTAMNAAQGGASDVLPEVRLHPDDLRTLQARDAVPPGALFTADETLAPGDAVTVLGDGIVDARIGAALERARRVRDEEA